MLRVRKRPIIVEAVQVGPASDAASRSWTSLPSWVRSAYENGDLVFLPDKAMVKTQHGDMEAGRSDWIIRGVEGELYPIKGTVFESTYDVVGQGAA